MADDDPMKQIDAVNIGDDRKRELSCPGDVIAVARTTATSLGALNTSLIADMDNPIRVYRDNRSDMSLTVTDRGAHVDARSKVGIQAISRAHSATAAGEGDVVVTDVRQGRASVQASSNNHVITHIDMPGARMYGSVTGPEAYSECVITEESKPLRARFNELCAEIPRWRAPHVEVKDKAKDTFDIKKGTKGSITQSFKSSADVVPDKKDVNIKNSAAAISVSREPEGDYREKLSAEQDMHEAEIRHNSLFQ